MNDGARVYDERNVGVMRVGPECAAEALSILREAAAWASARGIEVWNDTELREQDFLDGARLNQLAMGFAGGHAAAAMLLHTSDPVYWPEVVPGSSLYLHKIAVRRAYAGKDWLRRLIEFAALDAQARGIAWLRLDTIHGSPLRGLYERHGFAVVDEPALNVRGRLMIRMERALCRST